MGFKQDAGVAVTLAVEGQETGPADILAAGVNDEPVGLGQVVADGLEPFLVGVLLAHLDGHYPFQSVARGRGEEQLRLETGVGDEQLFRPLLVRAEVVEVEAEEAGVGEEPLRVPIVEKTRKGDEVEMFGLELRGLLAVADAAQFPRGAASLDGRANIIVHAHEVRLIIRLHRLVHWGLEEGEWCLAPRSPCSHPIVCCFHRAPD